MLWSLLATALAAEPAADAEIPRTVTTRDGVVTLEGEAGVPTLTEQSDAELVTDVERKLHWSPFVDVDAIDVTAHAGVVTLTGQVDGRFERTRAVESAYEAGARSVRNELRVIAPEGPQARVWRPGGR